MRHVIQKELLQLTLAPGVAAFGAQHSASRFNSQVLMPLLERAFDELASEDLVIRMDRLVVDLGVLNAEQLDRPVDERELYTRIIEQLRKQVSAGDAAAKVVSRRMSVLEQWWYYMERGRLPWNAEVVDDGWYRLVLESLAVDYAAVSRLRRALEANVVFRRRVSRQHPDLLLEKLAGILAGAKQLSLSQWIEVTGDRCSLLERLYMDEPILPLRRWRDHHATFLALSRVERKAALWELVLREAAVHPVAAKDGGLLLLLDRWLSDEPSIHRLLKMAAPLVGGDSRVAGDTGSAGDAGAADKVAADNVVSPDVFGAADVVDASHEAEVLPAGEWEGPAEQPIEAITNLAEHSRRAKEIEDKGMSSTLPVPSLDGRTTAVQRADEAATPVPHLPGSVQAPAESQQADAIADRTGTGDAEMALIKIDDGQGGGDLGEVAERLFDRGRLDEDGLFGRCAGAILLHPFLGTLFDRCGLYDKGKFVDGHARQLAVFLLYYLATGEKEGPEYDLLFPKVFCGYDPEQLLPMTAALPESAYTEADDLLQMVLQRWEKLQHSSVSALREGFLQRGGKLVNRNDRLVLMLETSAIDVLLDYLPWNLSIVKLPWWTSLLYVEWR